MPEWVIYPDLVPPVFWLALMALFVGYIVRIPRKTRASIAFLVAIAIELVQSGVSFLVIVLDASGLDSWGLSISTYRSAGFILDPAGLCAMVVFTMWLGPIRFRRTERFLIGLSAALVAFAALTLFFPGIGQSYNLTYSSAIPVIMLALAIVMYRKWVVLRRRTDEYEFNPTGYLAVGIFWLAAILLVAVVNTLIATGVIEPQRSYLAASISIITVLLVLGYLQFSGEQVSLESKVVAVTMLGLLLTVTAIVSPIDDPREWLIHYAEPLEPISLDFIPVEDGYRAEGAPPVFYPAAGDTLALADDGFRPLQMPFPFRIYGQEEDSLFVGANGILLFDRPDTLTFGATPDLLITSEGPVIAPHYFDLNPAESGEVRVLRTPDSLMVTWHEVPHFANPDGAWDARVLSPEQRSFNAQAVLRSDGSIRFNRGESGWRVTRPWMFGISPGQDVNSASGLTPSALEGSVRAGNLIPSHLPITTNGREALIYREHMQSELDAWATTASLPLLRNMFLSGILVFILVAGFFRLSVHRRLTRLMGDVRRVNEGDLSGDLDVRVKDEIGRLGTAFNGMKMSLRTYRDHLEDLVDERTAELRAAQAQLVEQEKLASLGTLTAGIAHEIKNPLNFVNNFAEVSEEMLDELAAAVSAGDADEAAVLLEELRRNARQIAKHGGRADSIVRSMMQHARGGTSERETIDVNAFVEEYVDLAWHGMRARDHTFQCDVERTLDPDVGAIDGQPQELGRVLLNLLNNAFYAVSMDGAEAEPTVRVATSREGGRVTITVVDSGPGISKDIRERIFEPFFTTKPTGEGTGLGLSLSYDIVTKGHGGEMTVENAPDGGAQFEVRLPA